MYTALFSSFIVPLALIVLWLVQTSGSRAMRATEQAQLNAAILSACHQDRFFLTKTVASINRKIIMLQRQMSAATAACQAAALAAVELGPGVYRNVFDECVRGVLPALEIWGRTLEFSQQSQTEFYYQTRRTQALELLIRQNGLRPAWVSNEEVRGLPIISSAFDRAALTPYHQSMKNLVDGLSRPTHWPQVWVGRVNVFSQSWRHSKKYEPHRAWMAPKSNDNASWQNGTIRTSEASQSMAGPISDAISFSRCFIEETLAGLEFRVVKTISRKQSRQLHDHPL